jgi:hypothetical protein
MPEVCSAFCCGCFERGARRNAALALGHNKETGSMRVLVPFSRDGNFFQPGGNFFPYHLNACLRSCFK